MNDVKSMRKAILAAKKIRNAAINRRIMIEPTPMCKICLDEEGEMISPCICRGTQRWVHRECLEMWRNRHHPLSPQHRFCMDCRAPYFGQDISYPDDVRIMFHENSTVTTGVISMITVLWFVSVMLTNVLWFAMILLMPAKMYDGLWIPTSVTVIISSCNSFNPILFKSLSGKKPNETDVSLTLILFCLSITSMLLNYMYMCIICVVTITAPTALKLYSCETSNRRRQRSTSMITPILV